MALLYLLSRHQYKPVVVHCNYGLRGNQSDKDQEMVEQICMLWNLECISVRLQYDSSDGGNFQNWARDERYRIFRELKKEFNAQFIVTAHHQDDQLETIFQKILRGSGISSLRGIEPLNNDLFRPLLDVTKEQILDFVEEYNVPYRIDASNEESTYARNFLRNRWFPMLEKFFPGWKTNLLSLTEKARVHQHLIQFVSDHMQYDNSSFSRNAFLNLKDLLKPVVFKSLFDRTLPNQTVNKGFLEEIQTIERLQTGQSVDITSSHMLSRDRDRFYFIPKKESNRNTEVLEINASDLKDGLVHRFVHASIGSRPKKFGTNELIIDVGKVMFPVTIREWEDGDSLRPFGMEGSQLVSDHLTNRKIPSHRKKDALVMQSFDGMIAAVIFPPEKDRGQPGTISEQVRADNTTNKIIKIEIIY